MPTGDVLPLDVYIGEDFYVPAFRLMIRGKDAEVQNNDVISVTYEDSLDKIDSFNLTVMNWDPESGPSSIATLTRSILVRRSNFSWGTTKTATVSFRVCSLAGLLPFAEFSGRWRPNSHGHWTEFIRSISSIPNHQAFCSVN